MELQSTRMRPKQLGWIAAFALLQAFATELAAAQHAGVHAPPPARAAAPPPHQHMDSRFSHNQYYFNRGYAARRPPPGSLGEFRDRAGYRYYRHGGDWYRWRGGWHRWWRGGWVVWGPPIGLFVPSLPPLYTTVWLYGVPYYYANDTYYLWRQQQQQYEIVAPPAAIDSAGSTQPPPNDQLYAYPKQGQSAEQQARDQYECQQLAQQRSGFDPSTAAAQQPPEKRDDYFRAQAGCLEDRGYAVR